MQSTVDKLLNLPGSHGAQDVAPALSSESVTEPAWHIKHCFPGLLEYVPGAQALTTPLLLWTTYPGLFLPALHLSLSRLLPTQSALLSLSPHPVWASQLAEHEVAVWLAASVLPLAQRETAPVLVMA